MALVERAMDIAHKAVATGLILGAFGSFAFCGYGFYDIVSRARLHKRLKAEQAAAAQTERQQ